MSWSTTSLVLVVVVVVVVVTVARTSVADDDAHRDQHKDASTMLIPPTVRHTSKVIRCRGGGRGWGMGGGNNTDRTGLCATELLVKLAIIINCQFTCAGDYLNLCTKIINNI